MMRGLLCRNSVSMHSLPATSRMLLSTPVGVDSKVARHKGGRPRWDEKQDMANVKFRTLPIKTRGNQACVTLGGKAVRV